MVILSDRSKSKKLSFKCSIELQAFRISFRKYRASLSLLFGLRCNPFCGRCCLLMLSFSMHSNCKAKKCLLRICIIKFAFSTSCRIIGFYNTILQLGSCFDKGANLKMGVSRKPSKSNFPKNKHFLPSDTRTYVCVSGGKKCSFFGKFGVLCFLETPVLKFALLPYS